MGKRKHFVVGYQHSLDMHAVVAGGRCDAIWNIKFDQKLANTGPVFPGDSVTIDAPNLYGGSGREGGVSGVIEFLAGSISQAVNSYLSAAIGGTIPAFRGVASLVFQQFYLGNNPYLKDFACDVQRIAYEIDETARWYPAKAYIYSDDVAFYQEITVEAGVHGGTTAAALVSAGVPVTGLDPTVTYLITLKRPTQANGAWSPWGSPNYIGGNSGSINRLDYVLDDNDATHVAIEDAGPNPNGTWNSYADALAGWSGPRYFSGASKITVGVIDNPIGDNSGTIEVIIARQWGPDINPAHIVREVIRDTVAGGSVPTSEIDDTAFTAAADALFAENFGMSIWWNPESETKRQLIDRVCAHIEAFHFVSRTTGKHTLKLIRNDYDPGADVVAFSEAEIIEVRPMWEQWHELPNRISLVYWDVIKDEPTSITDTNTAGVRAVGRIKSSTVDRQGIRSPSLAGRVLEREKQSLTQPKIRGTAIVTRAGADLHPGDVVSFTTSRANLAGEIMRVYRVREGIGVDQRVQIEFVQDVFALVSGTIVSPDETLVVDYEAQPATVRIIQEAPYYEVAQVIGDDDAEAKFLSDNDAGYVVAAVGVPASSHAGFQIWIDPDTGTYAEEGTGSFCPYGALDANLSSDPEDTTVAITGVSGLTQIATGSLAQIGAEIIRVDSISASSMTIGRGCLDTVPQAHSSGADILFWDELNARAEREFAATDTPDVKVLTFTGGDVLDLTEDTADTVTMASRGYRPLPPAQMQLEADYTPATISDADELTWTARNRLEETVGPVADFTTASETAESGTTYRLDVTGLDGALAPLAAPHFTDAAATSPYVMNESDYGTGAPGGTENLEIKLTSVRNGYDSWQSPTIIVPYIPTPGRLQLEASTDLILLEDGNRIELES